MSDQVEKQLNGSPQRYLMDRPAWWGGEDITHTGARFAEEVLSVSNLDWDVKTAPAYLFVDGEYRRVPAEVGTYRVDDGKIFTSGLGHGYTPIQNRDCFEVINELVQSDEVVIETAIALKDGRRVVVVGRRPEHIEIGGEQYDDYLVAATGHDGGHALQLFTTKVRVVCQNTLSYAKESARRIYKNRHTATYKDRIHQARSALEVSFKSTEDTAELADGLLLAKMNDREWFDLMDELWELPNEPGRKRTIREDKRAEASNVYFYEDNLNNIRGTRWGALQAVIQHRNWNETPKNLNSTFDSQVGGMDPYVAKATRVLTKS